MRDMFLLVLMLLFGTFILPVIPIYRLVTWDRDMPPWARWRL